MMRASEDDPNLDAPEVEASARLNRGCFCLTLDWSALCAAIAEEVGNATFCGDMLADRPYLFSNVTAFIPADAFETMRGLVAAIERVTRHPSYIEAVLAHGPEIAHADHGPIGAFMGYDFHLGSDGPRLIEINTNAGGAFFNAVLARAQRACCAEAQAAARPRPADGFEAAVACMFGAEWTRQRGPGEPLRRIVITDDRPQDQYLYPEFVLAQRLLARHGWEVEIADAASFAYDGHRLLFDGRPVDLVYNRLTDFALADPAHQALREAYAAGTVVLTPNPRNHALAADKRNLVQLSDADRLAAWGIDAQTTAALVASIPRTVMVSPDQADELWAGRRRLFFKPAGGFGSKAAYRGDKLTRAVWADILAGDYVAQVLTPPGERLVRVDGEVTARKLDVRLFTYDGEVLLVAARLYQGQTTNFRTPGGGFAPVFLVGEPNAAQSGNAENHPSV